MWLWGHHLPGLRPRSAQGWSVFRVLAWWPRRLRPLPWRWRADSRFTKRRSWSLPPRGHYTQLACSWKLILEGGKRRAELAGGGPDLFRQSACMSEKLCCSYGNCGTLVLWSIKSYLAESDTLLCSCPAFHLSSCTQVICCSSLNPNIEKQIHFDS